MQTIEINANKHTFHYKNLVYLSRINLKCAVLFYEIKDPVCLQINIAA